MIENDAEIRKTILARDALRREAHLPPLNIELEVRKIKAFNDEKIKEERYQSICQYYDEERKGIRDELIQEARDKGDLTFPKGFSSHYGLHRKVEKRFILFLSSRM